MFRRRLVPVTLVGWMRTPQPATTTSRVDHDSMLSTSSSILRQDCSSSSASSASSAALTESKRGIKTLAVREYKPMGQPIELRFYQRYTNNPLKQSGIQFLTHYNHYQRWRAHTKDYIDYMNWGKEQGQARLPHRHQRVAFDFHDSLPPTKTTYKSELFQTQDPSKDHSEGFDASFDPNKKTFSFPYHWNRLFSKRRPGEGDINTAPFGTRSLISKMQTYSDVGTEAAFYAENRAANHGIVPGINAPFLGEQDSKMMQSMSVPLCSKTNKVTTNEGRFSKSLYLNNAKNNQLVNAKFAKTLSTEIDKATNAVHSKLVVLTSAQSGLTESFCQGVDFTDIGLQMSKAKECRDKAEALTLSLGRSDITPAESAAIDRQLSQLLSDAHRYESRADNTLRLHSELMWRVFTAARPLMTIINGKCRGTGNGVALLSKFAVTRDSSEFTFDGPNRALTPFGGLTHYLARPETSLKYPGLAEFTMLTGASLFAGDVLRLGWTDLFSNTADLDFHIKDWFNNTEHMHNDAIAWQLGHLLDSTCKMREAHSGAVERCAITPTRARWIEDAFADQPSVESIVATLTEMEQLSTSDADPHNTRDGATLTPFTLTTVADGIMKLREQNMHYSLAPWDLTAPAEAVGEEHSGSMFTQYVLERRANVDVVLHSDRNKLRKWREQRYSEFKAHEALRKAPCARHVFVRLEGCEGRLVNFEFIFDKQSSDDNVLQTMNAATAAKKTKFKYDLTSEEQTQTAMVDAFSQSVRTAFGLNDGRLLSLGWYMPTFDTCPIHSDEELLEILAADPGVEDLSNPTRYPPLYFIVKRHDMHLSEWAYAVKHQLLLNSPYALKASLALLHEVRGSGASNDVASLSESISKEFKYIRRMISRREFAEVGQHTEHDLEYWTDVRDRRSKNVHEMENPLRPLRTFDDVFEHEVEISGHKFQVRPRWSPRTLEEVDDADIAKLVAPLDFERDATTELDVPTFASKQQYIVGMTDDAGVEVVAGLGEVDKATGVPKVAPLVSNAKVPDNVDFYEMARHPWLDTKSSWRQEGFTAGSQEYFVQQYQAAQKALYDAKGTGQYNYWPAKSDVEGNDWTEEEQTLLQDRFYSAFQEGEQSVQSWASTLRQQAKDGTFTKRLELATQDEKILDDNYYRWFIQPGVHPNPSGLTRRGLAATASSEEDMEVQRAFSSFGVHVDVEAATDTTQFAGEDSSGVVDDELYEVGSSAGSAAAEAGEE